MRANPTALTAPVAVFHVWKPDTRSTKEFQDGAGRITFWVDEVHKRTWHTTYEIGYSWYRGTQTSVNDCACQ